ncbi:MAG TPA: sigma factor, partial [Puia sp.]
MRPDKTLSLPTDTEIIDNLTRDGHNRRKAEDQLFNGFVYFVKEGIRKYSLEEDEALDVYSDTIISAIEKITGGLFEGRSSLKTYLFRIFHNKCVDRIRQLTTNKNKIHRNTQSPDLLSHLSDSA